MHLCQRGSQSRNKWEKGLERRDTLRDEIMKGFLNHLQETENNWSLEDTKNKLKIEKIPI